MACSKPLKHALLYCRESEVERNILWDWVMDTLPLNISVELHLLNDDGLIETIFGDMKGLRNLSNLCDIEKEIYFENGQKHFIY